MTNTAVNLKIYRVILQIGEMLRLERHIILHVFYKKLRIGVSPPVS